MDHLEFNFKVVFYPRHENIVAHCLETDIFAWALTKEKALEVIKRDLCLKLGLFVNGKTFKTFFKSASHKIINKFHSGKYPTVELVMKVETSISCIKWSNCKA
ncbi:MAG: hypothetical protein AB7O73_15745 [Bacteroidia bacterium]